MHACVCVRYAYIYTYIYTYIHAYIHTYIHTYIHVRIYTHLYTYQVVYAAWVFLAREFSEYAGARKESTNVQMEL